MARVRPVPNPVCWWLTAKLLSFIQNVFGGIRVDVAGPREFTEPVLFAMNHTHYFDFMQSRLALFRQCGLKTTSFVKPRAFQQRLAGAYVKTVGGIPIASRGYIISADFAQLHGRTLEEEEYRLLREHLNTGTPLPSSPVYDALQTVPREMLGATFDPAQGDYRGALSACYAKAMAVTIALAQEVVHAGHCLHIYPEGLYSSRLSKGRTGTVQLAAALNIPIVPVGFSGMNELFAGRRMMPHTKGVLTMRLGEPYRIQRAEFRDFTPFDSREEARLQPVLEEETQALMQKINDLVEPQCKWGDDRVGDGLKGVARFFE
jgi:1-acyl-sn-glycerol-3-phosphate acyltransferase